MTLPGLLWVLKRQKGQSLLLWMNKPIKMIPFKRMLPQ